MWPRLASSEGERSLHKLVPVRTQVQSQQTPKSFTCATKYICIMHNFLFFKNVTGISTPSSGNTLGVFPLSKKAATPSLTGRNRFCKQDIMKNSLAIQRGRHRCGDQAQEKGWTKRWNEKIEWRKQKNKNSSCGECEWTNRHWHACKNTGLN